MNEESLDKLRSKRDAYILAALCLRLEDYTEEGLHAVREAAAVRGLYRKHIDTFRELLNTEEYISVSCPECQRSLIIEQEELIAGEYRCDHCEQFRTIDFKSSPPVPKSRQEILNELDDGSLLRAFSFREGNYTQDEFERMREILSTRGFSDDDIGSFQQLLCSGNDATMKCGRCARELLVKAGDLWRGDTVCPYCNRRQFVDFNVVMPAETTASQAEGEFDEDYRGFYTGFHEDTPVPLSGLRGWLMVLGIWMCKDLMLSLFAAVVSWSQQNMAECISFLIWSGLIGYVLFLYFRKSKRFPGLYTFLVVLGLVLAAIYLGLAMAVDRTVDSIGEAFGMLLSAVVFAVIWIPYIKTSKRVKATFVR